jgi:hypothetical protein
MKAPGRAGQGPRPVDQTVGNPPHARTVAPLLLRGHRGKYSA